MYGKKKKKKKQRAVKILQIRLRLVANVSNDWLNNLKFNTERKKHF